MPYILPVERTLLEIYELKPPETGGQLNYIISRLIARYTEYHKLRYDVITEVRGAVLGALHEYERLVADPYENSKREENGDVWGTLV